MADVNITDTLEFFFFFQKLLKHFLINLSTYLCYIVE